MNCLKPAPKLSKIKYENHLMVSKYDGDVIQDSGLGKKANLKNITTANNTKLLY